MTRWTHPNHRIDDYHGPERRSNITWPVAFGIFLIVAGICLYAFAKDAQLERQQKLERLSIAEQEADLTDDEYVKSRSNHRWIAKELRECWHELDGIKKVLLEWQP